MSNISNILATDNMQKYLGTKIDDENKEKFLKFAEEYKLNTSTMLRIIISTLVENPELFSVILNKLHENVKSNKKI